jgi:hypothetical protein
MAEIFNLIQILVLHETVTVYSFNSKIIYFLYLPILRGLSLRANYRPTDRRLSTKLVPTFAYRGYHVVSVTDSYCRILGFLDRISTHIYL